MFKIVFIVILSLLVGCGSPSSFKPNTNVGSGGENLAPTATAKSVTVKKNTPTPILLSGKDPEKEGVTAMVSKQPSHGTYINGVYTPQTDYTGSDSFSFTVTDGLLSSAEAIISITITDSGDTPNPKPSTCKPLPKTGQTIIYHNGDDGDLQKGATRSYTRDDVNGIVTDNVTGLMWQDNESVQKPWVTQANYDAKNYMDTSGDTATTYCENLVLGSYGDWRLPTINELDFLVDSGREHPAIDPIFQNMHSNSYWSSTTIADDSSWAWLVGFSFGSDGSSYKLGTNSVRCVRNGH